MNGCQLYVADGCSNMCRCLSHAALLWHLINHHSLCAVSVCCSYTMGHAMCAPHYGSGVSYQNPLLAVVGLPGLEHADHPTKGVLASPNSSSLNLCFTPALPLHTSLCSSVGTVMGMQWYKTWACSGTRHMPGCDSCQAASTCRCIYDLLTLQYLKCCVCIVVGAYCYATPHSCRPLFGNSNVSACSRAPVSCFS